MEEYFKMYLKYLVFRNFLKMILYMFIFLVIGEEFLESYLNIYL